MSQQPEDNKEQAAGTAAPGAAGEPVAATPETQQAEPEAEPAPVAAAPAPAPEAAPEPAAAPAAGPGVSAGAAFFLGLLATLLVLAALAAVAYVTLPAWQNRIAAVLAGGGEERMGTIENRAAKVAEQVTALTGRVETLERAAAELRDGVARLARMAPAPSPTPPQAAAAPSADPARLDALSQRLAAVEQLPRVEPARVAALAETVERMGSEIAQARSDIGQTREQIAAVQKGAADAASVLRLANRIEAAESAVRQAQSHSVAAESLLLAVGQLREAANRGEGFDAELRAVRAIAPQDPQVAKPVETLAPLAASGVPTRTALAARFDDLAGRIVRAEFGPDEDGWVRQTLQRLAAVVTVRRVDGQNAGDSVAAFVSRAEAALRRADLAGAVQELSALQGPAAEVAAPWLAQAKARLAVDAALSELTAHAVALAQARG